MRFYEITLNVAPDGRWAWSLSTGRTNGFGSIVVAEGHAESAPMAALKAIEAMEEDKK